MTDARSADAAEGQSKEAEISNSVVALYKEQLGRGPTKAHTEYGRDLIVVSLEETMVPAERTLVEQGQAKRVADSRLLVMEGAEHRFCETIEQITGRKVRAMVCGMNADPDISTKVFYLEPGAA